ncbi:MAG: condensation domain-containing protein, partial [Anaerolineae bacterium]|nr:condensation domain-containing protein [Anaerolineae bacterium]
RRHLLAELPEYMVPSAFVVMDALPLTPNGKVDRKALPPPEEAERAELGTDYVPPSTPAERILADIWAQVLGVERVGAHDNFFELGGDSILSIQVVARANQAGLRLTPRQLFQAPTVAGLAALAQEAGAPLAEQGPVTGPVPLTPVQRWFFELDLPNRSHWNQTLLFAAREPLEPAALRRAVAALLAHHDALRLRFAESETGWTAVNAGFDPAEAEAVFLCHDLSALPDDQASAQVEALAAAAQRSLDIVRGPLLRVVYFDLGPARPGRLLITVHHLAVDGVSWRILLQDLVAAYAQAWRSPDAAIQLPPKTTSFKAWAEGLAELAASDAVRADLDAWLAMGEAWIPPLPVDTGADPAENTEGSADQVELALTVEETDALLHRAPAVYRTEINDLLLTALAQAIAGWTGEPTLWVHLEGHGREMPDEDAPADVSRTVGWFTSLYPVRLDLPDQGGPGEAIKAVKEQLRRVPQRGLSYGLLRYLQPDPDVAAALAALPPPELSFNYLGQLDQVLGSDMPLGPARESAGLDRDPAGRRPHLFDITAAVVGDRLAVGWTFSRAMHRRETVQRLAEDFAAALRGLIAHCLSPEAGGFTPSDFDLADLDQRKLEKVLRKIKG